MFAIHVVERDRLVAQAFFHQCERVAGRNDRGPPLVVAVVDRIAQGFAFYEKPDARKVGDGLDAEWVV